MMILPRAGRSRRQVIAVSSLFGSGHFYQGLKGIIDTGLTSLILGGFYFYSGRNLGLEF